MHLTANPHKHQERQLDKLGDGLYEILNEKAQDLKFGRTVKRDQKIVAKHYREQHKLQLEARAQGQMGRVEFQNWGWNMDEIKEKKNKGLFYYSMNGITTTKLDFTRENVKKKELKFQRQNRYQMIKDICQKWNFQKPCNAQIAMAL